MHCMKQYNSVILFIMLFNTLVNLCVYLTCVLCSWQSIIYDASKTVLVVTLYIDETTWYLAACLAPPSHHITLYTINVISYLHTHVHFAWLCLRFIFIYRRGERVLLWKLQWSPQNAFSEYWHDITLIWGSNTYSSLAANVFQLIVCVLRSASDKLLLFYA